MMRSVFVVVALALSATPALAQTATTPVLDPHAGHHMMMAQQAAPAAAKPDNPAIPPDNAASAQRLKDSPRHGEWVDIKMPSGPPIKSFVVYPERKDKAPSCRHPRHRRDGDGPRRRRPARERRLIAINPTCCPAKGPAAAPRRWARASGRPSVR
jgi:hypothetical protein